MARRPCCDLPTLDAQLSHYQLLLNVGTRHLIGCAIAPRANASLAQALSTSARSRFGG